MATPTLARLFLFLCAIVLCTLSCVLGHWPAAITNRFNTKPVQLLDRKPCRMSTNSSFDRFS